ncbi:NUDIX hydrolase [Nostoc linckia]|uniref:NUDIX hydrolase n=1 Tax=Nostoc linckia TaxID=92942 RepID=UPI000BFFDBC5|nr:NUDIX hydrolase [Nostoc linckia]PHJ94329.1 hypothetical protein VF09_37100 [Nostoc linckia z9]
MKRKQPDLPIQVAALPLRRREDGLLETCLVTTRETRRWVLPKGWPVPGLDLAGSAGLEAREEAGLIGRVRRKPLDSYRYWKRGKNGWQLIEVVVHTMKVQRRLKRWSEQNQRQRRWLPLAEAAELIKEHELQLIMRQLAE